MTIYDIPSLVRHALPLAATPVNITKGFKVSGIQPFNRDIFGDDEFLPANVTDQPPPPIPPQSFQMESVATTSADLSEETPDLTHDTMIIYGHLPVLK